MKKVKIALEIIMSTEDYNEAVESLEMEGETFSSAFQDTFGSEYDSCKCTHTVEDTNSINPSEHEQVK